MCCSTSFTSFVCLLKRPRPVEAEQARASAFQAVTGQQVGDLLARRSGCRRSGSLSFALLRGAPQ